MRKTLLALSVVAASTTAFANPIAEENFNVNGAVMVGSYYDQSRDGVDQDEVFNGGATGFDLIVDYRYNNFLAKFGIEADLSDDYSLVEGKTAITNTWVGYDLGFGIASVGFNSDSALDMVDAGGDLTVEFGHNADDASDVGSVASFYAERDVFVFGASYYADRNMSRNNDIAVSGINGYVGVRGDNFKINLGYESNDLENLALTSPEEIILVNGTMNFGTVNVGASYNIESFNTGAIETKEDERTSYTVSVSNQINDNLYVAMGYNNVEYTKEYVNVGGKYKFDANKTLLLDVAYHLQGENELSNYESGDVQAFARFDVSF